MTTSRLFYEDDRDALTAMIAESGKTRKECDHHLWPNMKPDSAYAKLVACLDINGDEELRFSQVVALMRYCNKFDPLYYACDETLHGRPDRRAPDDQKVALVEVIKDAAATMSRAMEQIKSLEARR